EFVATIPNRTRYSFLAGWLVLHAVYFGAFLLPIPPGHEYLLSMRPADFPAFILFTGIGLTFFRTIAYYHDRLRRHQPRMPVMDYLTYGTYLPQFPHGPIERPHDALFKLQNCRRFWTPRTLLRGIGRLSWGIFLFWLLWRAGPSLDALHRDHPTFVDKIDVAKFFDAPQEIPAWVFLLLMFGMPAGLYYIESAWAHIALGISLCYGFLGEESYKRPFLNMPSANFLWKHWNITLMHWLRDYVYAPLGAGKHRYRNTFINMTYCGLIHGPQLRFLAWGAFVGATMSLGNWIAEKMRGNRKALKWQENPQTPLDWTKYWIATALTMCWASIAVLIIADPEHCGTRTIPHFFRIIGQGIANLFEY
ncbi:MAG: MBOAT family O-acyltransferase, partial [Phycisphaerae bacterium]